MARYACKLNTITVGGASKLFQHFIRHYQPQSIISYADRRFSIGSLYNKLGFACVRKSSPNYFYTKNGHELESRIKFQKHKLSDILECFNPLLTEYQNMLLNGYDRI